MKAKCIQLEAKNVERGYSDGWLRIGEEYEVLSVYYTPDEGVLLRIVGEDRRTPALFSGELFEITDPHIPRNWILVKDERGVFRMSPRPWLQPGFWNSYFDGDAEAAKAFEEQRTFSLEL